MPYLDEDELLDSLAVDDSELFAVAGFSTGLGFGGRPLGFGAGFALGGGAFLRAASASLSDELSGEKMLFFFEVSAAVFAALLPGALLFLGSAPGLELVVLCNCFTTDGGAFPPVDCSAAELAAFFARALGASAFFFISF